MAQRRLGSQRVPDLNDLFFAGGYGDAYLPPPKRKRMGSIDGHVVPSKITDTRIAASAALRLDCDILTVTVGKDDNQGTFKVHQYAICDRSEFFRNTLKPEWASMRADPLVVELPEDDPEAFSLYHTWLYSGRLPVLADTDATDTTTVPLPDSGGSEDPSIVGGEPEHYHSLAYAYVLGERLIDTPFKNAIADAYVLYARGNPPTRRCYPSNEDIRILYEGTRDDSPIRRLLIDIWYCRGRMEWIEKDTDLPSEFLAGVVKELFRVRASVDSLSRPWKNSHEQYHEKEKSIVVDVG